MSDEAGDGVREDMAELLAEDDVEKTPVDEARDLLGIEAWEDPVDALLANEPGEVTGPWMHKRTGAVFTIRAIEDDKTFTKLQSRATEEVRQRSGRRFKELNADRFNRLLIMQYTSKPSFDPASADFAKLCGHYGVDPDAGPESLIRKMLLKGEMASLADAIMTLSGFDDDPLVEAGKD